MFNRFKCRVLFGMYDKVRFYMGMPPPSSHGERLYLKLVYIPADRSGHKLSVTV